MNKAVRKPQSTVRPSRTVKIFLWIIVVLFILLLFSNYCVVRDGGKYCHFNVKHIPDVSTGLLLGTAKYYPGRRINPYYAYRIDAAIRLYESRKIKRLIVSGTVSEFGYNEPEIMRKDLIKHGIKKDHILLDNQGSRTFKSVRNAVCRFSSDSLIIISQPFHNERAVFIARRYGIQAWGYNAFNLLSGTGFKIALRERFARMRAVWDVTFNI